MINLRLGIMFTAASNTCAVFLQLITKVDQSTVTLYICTLVIIYSTSMNIQATTINYRNREENIFEYPIGFSHVQDLVV